MGDFEDYCRMLLAPISRVDQRRAGEAYLYGLLHCSGRKSVRRLAAGTTSPGEQALRQFISQSPWDPVPIRRRLATHLARSMQPAAWVVEEVVFPKHGRMSAAVGRQYARSRGKILNCQLGVAVSLTDSRCAVPVNWRLAVPDEWGADTERRARARLPDDARPRPFWHYQVQAVQEMARGWQLPPAPVLVDATNRVGVEPLLAALERRNLSFLVRVSSNLSLSCNRPLPADGAADPWRGAVEDLAARVAASSPETAEEGPDEPAGGAGPPRRSRFLRLAVRPLVVDSPGGRAVRPLARQLLCEWPPDQPRPVDFWITNLIGRPLAELVRLIRLAARAGARIEELAARCGLRDHEGRTFAGWHHHVTLVAAAYAYHLRDLLAGAPGPLV